jgi:tRNA(Ile)-lysidine synthase
MGLFRSSAPDALIAPVRRALQAIQPVPACVAAAVSGGADSAMLALAAAQAARDLNIKLLIFHVHHGLREQAGAWGRLVDELGRILGVPVCQARVIVPADTGKGIEAAAREARYQALAGLSRRHGAAHALLAHHRDDQAETVLLRLLRGAGVHGMAAMSAVMRRDGVTYLRPWLDVDRAAIFAAAGDFTREHGWRPAGDPTNADPRYARAAVRTLLTPVLNQRWPGWQAIVARHARHMAEAAAVLDEAAQADLVKLGLARDGASFSLAAWRALSEARQDNVLRAWLAGLSLSMPSDARLTELARQLRQLHALGHDRGLRWEHANRVVGCVKGRVTLM